MSGGNEGVHPPVGGFGQQVNEGLQETNAKVLEVLRRLHLGGVGETHISLRRGGGTDGQMRVIIQLSVINEGEYKNT